MIYSESNSRARRLVTVDPHELTTTGNQQTGGTCTDTTGGGATMAVSRTLDEIEKRITIAEESYFGPRPCDPESEKSGCGSLSGLLRSNTERSAKVLARMSELLGAIGI